MPTELLLACILSSLLAVVVTWYAARSLSTADKNGEKKRRRWGAFMRRAPWALTSILLALLLVAVAVGMRGYKALTREDAIANVVIIRAAGEDRFVAAMTLANGEKRKVVLVGDQIQVDARILKWAPWVNILGLHTSYNLDRIQGRFTSTSTASKNRTSVVALAEKPMVDLFAVATALPFLAPIVDAAYGSSSYVDAEDGAKWDLMLSTSGLLFRPR